LWFRLGHKMMNKSSKISSFSQRPGCDRLIAGSLAGGSVAHWVGRWLVIERS